MIYFYNFAKKTLAYLSKNYLEGFHHFPGKSRLCNHDTKLNSIYYSIKQEIAIL